MPHLLGSVLLDATLASPVAASADQEGAALTEASDPLATGRRVGATLD